MQFYVQIQKIISPYAIDAFRLANFHDLRIQPYSNLKVHGFQSYWRLSSGFFLYFTAKYFLAGVLYSADAISPAITIPTTNWPIFQGRLAKGVIKFLHPCLTVFLQNTMPLQLNLPQKAFYPSLCALIFHSCC